MPATTVAASPPWPLRMSTVRPAPNEREEHQVREGVLKITAMSTREWGMPRFCEDAVGDGGAAHAAGGEEMGGGEPREVDAQGQAEAHRVAPEAEQAAEEQRVEEERDALDGDRDDRATPESASFSSSTACACPASRGTMRNSATTMTRKMIAARHGWRLRGASRVAQRFLPPRRWRAAGARWSPSKARSISWRRIHA